MPYTEEEIKLIVGQAVREAVSSSVRETLIALGIDASNPLKTQQHMEAVREIAEMLDDDDFKKDMSHLRKWRQSVDKVSDVSVRTAIGIVVTGFFGFLLFAVKAWLEKH